MGAVDRVRQVRTRLVDRLMPHHVVYHHVPKCGGTSVGRALRMRYLLSQSSILPGPAHRAMLSLDPQADVRTQWNSTLQFRESMLLYLMHCDTRCISAHVAFSNAAYREFHSRYAFITLLREPVARYISHYYYGVAADDPKSGISLDAFVGTPMGRSFGTRYVEYFRGEANIDNLDLRESIDAAKANLHRFAAIGFLDRIDDFSRQLRKLLNVRISVGHENKARRGNDGGQRIDAQLMRRIETDCAPDIEIYEYARRHFGAGS